MHTASVANFQVLYKQESLNLWGKTPQQQQAMNTNNAKWRLESFASPGVFTWLTNARLMRKLHGSVYHGF